MFSSCSIFLFIRSNSAVCDVQRYSCVSNESGRILIFLFENIYTLYFGETSINIFMAPTRISSFGEFSLKRSLKITRTREVLYEIDMLESANLENVCNAVNLTWWWRWPRKIRYTMSLSSLSRKWTPHDLQTHRILLKHLGTGTRYSCKSWPFARRSRTRGSDMAKTPLVAEPQTVRLTCNLHFLVTSHLQDYLLNCAFSASIVLYIYCMTGKKSTWETEQRELLHK